MLRSISLTLASYGDLNGKGERRKTQEKDLGSAPWEQASAAEQQEIWYLEMPRYSAAIRPGVMLAVVTLRVCKHCVARATT